MSTKMSKITRVAGAAAANDITQFEELRAVLTLHDNYDEAHDLQADDREADDLQVHFDGSSGESD